MRLSWNQTKLTRLILLCHLLLVPQVLSSSKSENNNNDYLDGHSFSICTAESNTIQYSCPSCDGKKVKDCFDECAGYVNTDNRNNVCFKRKIFNKKSPEEGGNFLWNDIAAAFAWFIASGVATACGVGGGGIYVPLGILLLKFSSKSATGLSQASIFGASLGGLLLNIHNRHPNNKISDTIIPDVSKTDEDMGLNQNAAESKKFYTRPLIDYDMALFLAPMEMAGAVLGVLIQKLLPNWLFLTLAGIVLGITSYKTYQKFFIEYSRQKGFSKKNEHDESSTDSTRLLKYADNDSLLIRRRALLEDDARQYPIEKFLSFGILWVGLTFFTFLQGGKGVESLVGITCESYWYYILIIFKFCWTGGFAAFFGNALMKKHASRVEVNYPFLPKDVLWDSSKILFYSRVTFLAGAIAGLIGVGGGMVLGPLMLIMGVEPLVSAATTATMIVLTSSSVAISFITSGLVPWQYSIFFFGICLIGSYIGKNFIDSYVKKTGMSSILIAILATIIALSTIGCFVIVYLNLSKAGWCFDGFKKFCTVSSKSNLCLNE